VSCDLYVQYSPLSASLRTLLVPPKITCVSSIYAGVLLGQARSVYLILGVTFVSDCVPRQLVAGYYEQGSADRCVPLPESIMSVSILSL